MVTKREETREDLRAMGIPNLLIDEAFALDALGLDRPAPTAELVAKTLESCRETLERMQPVRAVEPEPWGFPSPAPAVGDPFRATWAHFVGAVNASVLADALPFCQAHPEQAAIVVVDNHAVVDPEDWDADQALGMLRGTYRTAVEALARANARPLYRLVVLKDRLDAYDDRDLAAIRRAIQQPMTKNTYVLSNAHARELQGRSCMIIGQEMMFELSPRIGSGEPMLATPSGTRNPEMASKMRAIVSGLQATAMPLYSGEQLSPRFQWALESDKNDRLRKILSEMIHG